MSAAIVRCYEDVMQFYYYKKDKPPQPNKYPCVMLSEYEDGGLRGSHYSYTFVYAPDAFDPESWLAGYAAGRQQ